MGRAYFKTSMAAVYVVFEFVFVVLTAFNGFGESLLAKHSLRIYVEAILNTVYSLYGHHCTCTCSCMSLQHVPGREISDVPNSFERTLLFWYSFCTEVDRIMEYLILVPLFAYKKIVTGLPSFILMGLRVIHKPKV